jgi:hypothetical protein
MTYGDLTGANGNVYAVVNLISASIMEEQPLLGIFPTENLCPLIYSLPSGVVGGYVYMYTNYDDGSFPEISVRLKLIETSCSPAAPLTTLATTILFGTMRVTKANFVLIYAGFNAMRLRGCFASQEFAFPFFQTLVPGNNGPNVGGFSNPAVNAGPGIVNMVGKPTAGLNPGLGNVQGGNPGLGGLQGQLGITGNPGGGSLQGQPVVGGFPGSGNLQLGAGGVNGKGIKGQKGQGPSNQQGNGGVPGLGNLQGANPGQGQPGFGGSSSSGTPGLRGPGGIVNMVGNLDPVLGNLQGQPGLVVNPISQNQPGLVINPGLGNLQNQPGLFNPALGNLQNQPGLFNPALGNFQNQPGLFNPGPGNFQNQPGLFGPGGPGGKGPKGKGKGPKGFENFFNQPGFVGNPGFIGQPGVGNVIGQPGLGNVIGQPGLGNVISQPGLGNVIGQPGLGNVIGQPGLGNGIGQPGVLNPGQGVLTGQPGVINPGFGNVFNQPGFGGKPGFPGQFNSKGKGFNNFNQFPNQNLLNGQQNLLPGNNFPVGAGGLVGNGGNINGGLLNGGNINGGIINGGNGGIVNGGNINGNPILFNGNGQNFGEFFPFLKGGPGKGKKGGKMRATDFSTAVPRPPQPKESIAKDIIIANIPDLTHIGLVPSITSSKSKIDGPKQSPAEIDLPFGPAPGNFGSNNDEKVKINAKEEKQKKFLRS